MKTFDIKTSKLKPGEWNEFQYVDGKTVLPFKIYVPENYTSESNVPLQIFLHGDGTNGANVDTVINGGEATTVRRTLLEQPNPQPFTFKQR